MSPTSSETIAVVGLGYVGLPLATALAEHFPVISYDTSPTKLSAPAEALLDATFYIVAVPTPLDENRRPDLGCLERATALIGRYLKKGDVVVYESTVYPGVTEGICVPLLVDVSGLSRNDFQVAYSPERINPGDLKRSLKSVTKIIAAQDEATIQRVESVYRKVVDAELYRAPSIRVAEAAKVLENTQRDLNIALMNEMAMIFARENIDTQAVIDAAATKWNFHDYRPGFVGGHCIGVDPYYIAHYAEHLGYRPEVILAGRRVNDSMGYYVAKETVKELIHADKNVAKSKVGILGIAFKANVPDTRNSRTYDLILELHDHFVCTVIYDPLVKGMDEFHVFHDLDAIIVTVMHDDFRELSLSKLRSCCGETPVLMDVRSAYDPEAATSLGFNYWRL